MRHNIIKNLKLAFELLKLALHFVFTLYQKITPNKEKMKSKASYIYFQNSLLFSNK